MSRALATRLIATLVLLASAMPAVAQVESREGIALQNQILELRRQMQTLQDQTNRGGGSPTNLGRGAYPQPSTGGSDLVAQLLSRVDALEDQVRQLRGRVDETQNEVQRQGADLGKRIDDMAFQAQTPRGGPPPPTGSPQPGSLGMKSPPASLGAPAAAAPSVTPPPDARGRDAGGQRCSCTARLSGSRAGSARSADQQSHLAARL